jgi:hypothetical protein
MRDLELLRLALDRRVAVAAKETARRIERVAADAVERDVGDAPVFWRSRRIGVVGLLSRLGWGSADR